MLRRPHAFPRGVLRGLTVSALLILPACTPTNASNTEGGKVAVEGLAMVAADGPVSVQVIPQYDSVYRDAMPGQLDVLVRLSGDEDAQTRRPDLDLAIVVDRSGSMGGDKIRAVKQASLDLLKEMQADDHVTLVTYSSDVVVHEEHMATGPEGIRKLRSHLLPMEAMGGTALGPAVIQTLELLEAHRSKDELRHVVLFSDGQANEGEDRPDVLGQRAASAFGKGVSVSTLGVGLDYNEDLMTRLADEGGGRYQFIKDANSISQVLGDELAGLVSTVASEVTLQIKPVAGVEVVEVFGYPMTREDGVTKVRVGSLAAGQTREIVVRLQLPKTDVGNLALGMFETSFKPVEGEGGQNTGLRSIPIEASVMMTDDEKGSLASEHTDVTVRVAEVEAAALMDEATMAVDRGDFDGAESILLEMKRGLEQDKASASSPAVKQAIEDQIADVEEASGSIGEAKQSESMRKVWTKGNKARSYSKKKGYKGVPKESKKKKKGKKFK